MGSTVLEIGKGLIHIVGEEKTKMLRKFSVKSFVCSLFLH
jgi:hypothetical protein